MSWVLYRGPVWRKERTHSFKMASDPHMRSVVCPSRRMVCDPWSWSYRPLWAAWGTSPLPAEPSLQPLFNFQKRYHYCACVRTRMQVNMVYVCLDMSTTWGLRTILGGQFFTWVPGVAFRLPGFWSKNLYLLGHLAYPPSCLLKQLLSLELIDSARLPGLQAPDSLQSLPPSAGISVPTTELSFQWVLEIKFRSLLSHHPSLWVFLLQTLV